MLKVKGVSAFMRNLNNKPTTELLSELTSPTPLAEYIADNRAVFLNGGLSESLLQIIREKNLKKSAVLKRAEINEIYGYQIFSGTRRPSRDKLISVCIGMFLSLDETQTILKSNGYPVLYPKIKRDSIIIKCISSEKSVFETNGVLFEYGQELL